MDCTQRASALIMFRTYAEPWNYENYNNFTNFNRNIGVGRKHEQLP